MVDEDQLAQSRKLIGTTPAGHVTIKGVGSRETGNRVVLDELSADERERDHHEQPVSSHMKEKNQARVKERGQCRQ